MTITEKLFLCIPQIKKLHDEILSLRTQIAEIDSKKREMIAQKEALYKTEIEKLQYKDNKKLNLGCGPYTLADWTNIDGGDGKNFDPPIDDAVVKLDVFEALAAIEDDSVEYISSEQFFEHFTRQEGFRLLLECFRVLKKGGVIRTQVPDLYTTVKSYLDEYPAAPWETVQLPHRLRHISGTRDPYGKLLPNEKYFPAMMINNGFHMDGHKFLYDYQTLEQLLSLAGFRNIEKCKFGDSRHDALKGIEHHDGGDTGRSWIPDIALIVEATK